MNIETDIIDVLFFKIPFISLHKFITHYFIFLYMLFFAIYIILFFFFFISFIYFFCKSYFTIQHIKFVILKCDKLNKLENLKILEIYMEFISDKLIYTNIQYKITKQPLLYTYTYAYIHTYIHTYVHTYIHQEYIYQGWSCCILSRQSQCIQVTSLRL